MAKILFRLRQVPEDEADEVRQLMDDHAIDWYETSAGRFMISFPAIWLRDESQEDRARALLEEYQRARTQRVRAERAEREANGELETLAQRIVANPAATMLVLLAIAFIFYISITPFLSMVLR